VETIKNILLPVDGSLQSRIAVDMTVFLAKLFNSQVTVMHVISNEIKTISRTYTPRENYAPIGAATGQFPRTLKPAEDSGYLIPEEVVSEVINTYRSEGEILLSEMISLFNKEGIAVKRKLLEGEHVAQAILDEAEKENHDLVIIGSSGDNEREADLHLGSIATKLAHATKRSLLVVRQKSRISKILVPVDGSAREAKALESAKLIATATLSKTILLHVQEQSHLRIRPEIRDVGVQVLNQTAKQFDEMNPEKQLFSGDPAKVIIETAKKDNVDLVVMSKGHPSGLAGLLLGSVSDHVVHHATVPVLLVV